MKMKNMFSLLAISLCIFCTNSFAQTNLTSTATNVLSGAGASPGTIQAVGATLGFLVDAEPYVKNGDSLWEVGALKSGSHYGGYFDVQLPVSTNSWQATYGFAFAYVDKQFYSGALNVSLGTTVNIPVLSNFIGPVYTYVESGPGYNLKAHQFVVQSFAGIKYMRQISDKWSIGGSYGYGIISDVKEHQQQFGLEIAYKFGK